MQEAQYAHQIGVEMIPMMMESPEKKVRGWLGKSPGFCRDEKTVLAEDDCCEQA